MTHSMIAPEEQVKERIDPGGLRICVGLENVQDVLQELKRAVEEI